MKTLLKFIWYLLSAPILLIIFGMLIVINDFYETQDMLHRMKQLRGNK